MLFDDPTSEDSQVLVFKVMRYIIFVAMYAVYHCFKDSSSEMTNLWKVRIIGEIRRPEVVLFDDPTSENSPFKY